jgi:hypothetical protein
MVHSYFAMFIIMMISGLLSSMNVWVDKWDDIRLSLNDIYMSLLMSGWMIFFMAIINNDYLYIFISLAIIVFSFFLIRNQIFIDEFQYLTGMIPHHSMAVMMSKALKNKSNTILPLLENIIQSQEKEINYMKAKLLSKNY